MKVIVVAMMVIMVLVVVSGAAGKGPTRLRCHSSLSLFGKHVSGMN
jgi:hypothetical protein